MTEEYYPELRMADVQVEPAFATELVSYEEGYSQTRALRNHPLYGFTLRYPVLKPAEFDTLLNFFLGRRGMFETFFFQDHYDPNPRGRVFGVATGTQLRYQLPHNWTENVVIKADASVIGAVYVDPLTGAVVFDVAPAADSLLTYDADNAAYRVRFATDGFQYTPEKFFAYGGNVKLQQVADVEDRYPISQRVMGGTITDATIDATGEAVAFSFACPVALSVINLCYYVGAVTTPGTVRVSLCANDSGEPGTIIVSATHVPAAVGWQQVPVVATALTQGTRYWLVIEAFTGTWDATHTFDVRYTVAIPYLGTLDRQDDILWGGYIVADLSEQNTPHSWMAVSLRTAAGVWGERDAFAHGAFYLNVAGVVVGHCQDPLTQVLSGDDRARFTLPLVTTHDITIDRVGAVISSPAVPADHLYYRIEVSAAPGVTQRTGTLATAISTAGGRVYAECYLTTPLILNTGDTVYIDFYSPLSAPAAAWTIYGTRWHVGSDFETGWDLDWDGIVYGGPGSAADISHDAGVNYLAGDSIEGAWAVRCRGWWEA